MSAAEVIELIKRLPPKERAEVYAFVEKLEAETRENRVKYIPSEVAERVSEKVFEQNKELFRRLAQ